MNIETITHALQLATIPATIGVGLVLVMGRKKGFDPTFLLALGISEILLGASQFLELVL